MAIDLPLGPALIEAISQAWSAGDAVTVLEPGWEPAVRSRAMATLRPTLLVDGSGRRRLDGGEGIEAGDALVVLTSGSVADPKAAVLSMEAVAASARISSSALGVDPGRHRWLACLPASHIGGLSVIARSLLSETEVEAIAEPTAEAISAAAARGATHVSVVTRLLSRMDPAAFELVLVGGAAPPSTRPRNVIATYGMTETGSGIAYDGRCLEGVCVHVEQPDADGFGELLISSPTLARGYRDRPLPLAEGPDGSSSWLRSGDLGRFGSDGLLEVRGRLGDVIATGGEKVHPADVEAILSRLPSIAEVAVAGRVDPEWGQRVVAFVVPAGEPPTLDELRGAVAEELGRHAAPKELMLLDALPRTAAGKLRRSALS